MHNSTMATVATPTVPHSRIPSNISTTSTGSTLPMLSININNNIPSRESTPCGRVILGRTLQAGAHGEVRVGTALAGSLRGCKVAVKVAHATEEARLRLVQEARILTQVLPPHPNVVGTYNLLKPTVCRATGDVYMPMELCDTDLLMVLLGKPLARSQMQHYARQLVRAVMHCHAHNVFHLDIKPENVFVDLRADSMKLGDFGMAAVLDAAAGGRHRGQHGSASYAAPEVWNSVDEDMEEEEDVGAGGGVGGSSTYDAAKADVWSLGAVLFTMVMRRRPWEDVHVTDKDFAHYLRHGSFRRYSSDPTPEADMMELILQMMDMNPSRRPSLEAVLKALGGASSSSKVSTASTTVTAAAASSASAPSSVGAGGGAGAGASPAPSCESPCIDEDEDGRGESPVVEDDDADGDCDMGVDVDDDAVDEDHATPIASIGLDSVSVMLPVDKSMCA